MKQWLETCVLPVACSSLNRLVYVGPRRSGTTTRRPLMRSVILTGALMCLCFMSSCAYNPGTSWRNTGAFSALLDDGTMRTWGQSARGGGSYSDSGKIRAVYSTQAAFTAVVEGSGQAVSWGHASYGGTAPSPLNQVRVVTSTNRAFCALTEQGTVVAWGASDYGGEIPSDLDMTNVQTVYATQSAFAALKQDGTVIAWGDPKYGGSNEDAFNYYGVPTGLENVRTIFSNPHAFAALLHDGSVRAWGFIAYGGGRVPVGLANVTAIYSTVVAFAALCEGGTIVAWGAALVVEQAYLLICTMLPQCTAQVLRLRPARKTVEWLLGVRPKLEALCRLILRLCRQFQHLKVLSRL